MFFYSFWAENGPGRAWEVLKKLLGGGTLILTEYGTVGSHGDPIHYVFWARILCPKSQFFVVARPGRAGPEPGP